MVGTLLFMSLPFHPIYLLLGALGLAWILCRVRRVVLVESWSDQYLKHKLRAPATRKMLKDREHQTVRENRSAPPPGMEVVEGPFDVLRRAGPSAPTDRTGSNIGYEIGTRLREQGYPSFTKANYMVFSQRVSRELDAPGYRHLRAAHRKEVMAHAMYWVFTPQREERMTAQLLFSEAARDLRMEVTGPRPQPTWWRRIAHNALRVVGLHWIAESLVRVQRPGWDF